MADFVWGQGKGRVIVDGVGLEAQAWGPPPGDAPTLALLHEGLGCVELWRDFPQKLVEATGFGVVAYSRAGYGGSDPVELPRPLDYMQREAREVLGKLLGAVGFQRGLLIGHSDGGSIAAVYAGEAGDPRVRGLVLIAPHFFTEPAGLAAINAARAAYLDGDLRARLSKYHRHVDCAFHGWCDSWLDPGFRGWNIADSIDYWRVPALAIQGEDDAYGTLDQIREIETRAYSPVETLILPDCRHAPHLERPAETLGAISDFCARLQRIEAAAPVTRL